MPISGYIFYSTPKSQSASSASGSDRPFTNIKVSKKWLVANFISLTSSSPSAPDVAKEARIPTGVRPLRWVDSSSAVPMNSLQVQARLAQPL